MSLKVFLKVFGFIAILLTIIPVFGANYWWIRMFDFPHLQLTLLTLLAILVYMIKFDQKSGFDIAFPIILLVCFAYQLIKIFPYTELAGHDIYQSEVSNPSKRIKLYTANVLQSNKNTEELNSEIKKYDADILLFTETNSRWQKAILESLPSSYKYKKEVPLNNTYGMLLYSKFKLLDPEVKYLVSDSIPSIHTKIVSSSNDTIQFYSIHPTPPMPQHNPKSTDRDAEMMKIALLAKESKYPIIVMGDFNDVAWSSTTQLFEEVSGLLDLRKGRGLFNTFNAKNVLMRWPLDHIFISEEFRLLKMERGSKINSDHFPVFTEINLEPEKASEQIANTPREKQLEKANKIAARIQ